jgi:hypothetical protein
LTSRAFLDLLWEDKPENQYILIWTLQDKCSRWFQDTVQAAEFVAEQHDRDVYVGVGLAARDYGPMQRCPSREIAGITGLWADFDIRSDAHNKKPLPPTIPDALSLLPQSIPPTIVVATGNGAHAWWLLKEPLIFNSDTEREDTAKLVARWQTMLSLNAASRGWAFDRLSDLARILRIPGTVNAKDPSNPKPITIHSTTHRRYNASDFAEFLDAASIPDPESKERAAREWAGRFEDKPLLINLSARVPEENIKSWMAEDERFARTWLRERDDLKDASQSGYDMALADFGVAHGLSEQEIIDLIVTHRAKHGQAQRQRVDYFQRTIAKALERSGSSPKTVSVLEPSETLNTDPATAKALLCEQISQVVGIRVLRLVKLSGKSPVYHMELESGTIEFGRVEKLIEQRAFRNALAAAVGVLMPKFKPKVWEQVAQTMLDACIVEDGGEESHLDGMARLHVESYLADSHFIASPLAQSVQSARKPIVHEGKVAICSSDLQMYVNKTTGQNQSIPEIVSMLKALGCKPERVRSRKFKEQSRWLLPLEEFDPVDYRAAEREPGDDDE